MRAMGVNKAGFSHTDELECYACHTSWRQTCFGCHVTVDDRGTGRNQTTGENSLGAISVVRDTYSLDFFALGVNERGKISPLCNSMSMFWSYIDSEGRPQFSDGVRKSRDGDIGFGWNPFHHHTVSLIPQGCDRCHPTDIGPPSNSMTLSETYGFGNGQVLSTDGAGRTYDLSAYRKTNGELLGAFPHANTGPVPLEVYERAMSIEVGY